MGATKGTLLPKGRRAWRRWHLWSALLLATIGAWMVRDALVDIVRIGLKDEEASHILLAPLIIGWLVWARRHRLRIMEQYGTWIGPVVVAVGWLFYAVGYMYWIQVFWHFGAVLVVTGCALSIWGMDVLRRFLPAFVALAFILPVPGTIRQMVGIPMQTITAEWTRAITEVCGFDVVRSGNQLLVNEMPVNIAEACNGMRMVFTLVLVSFTYAFTQPLRNGVRFLILLASPLSAIFFNVVRLIPTVLLYGYADHTTAEQFHDISGWVMLIVAFLSLMGLIELLRWALVPVQRFTLAHA